MRILVTGAGGFIGSHLCEALLAKGFKVRAFVRYNSFQSSGWLENIFHRNLEVVNGDITDFDSVNNAILNWPSNTFCMTRHDTSLNGEVCIAIPRSTGNIGIGTTNPGAQLEINNPGGSAAATFRLQGGLGGQIQFRNNSFPTGTISSNATGDMTFFTGTGSSGSTSSKITIVGSSGNVGIGTTGPASKLEVDGGDIEVDDSASGLILRAPNGTRYRVKVDNSGNLTTTTV